MIFAAKTDHQNFEARMIVRNFPVMINSRTGRLTAAIKDKIYGCL